MLWALQSNHPHNRAPDELYSTDHHNIADGLTTLPQDYAGIAPNIPKIGGPLLDLRHPAGTAESQPAALAFDAEQQRANQETEAARTSKLFASTTASVAPPRAASPETATKTGPSSDETFTQNGQDSKLLFVNAPVDRRTTAPDRLSRPVSPFVIQAETIIPCGSHYRDQIRSTGTDHSASYRSGLRQPDRPGQARPARSTIDRRL